MLFGCCTNMLIKEKNAVGLEYVETLKRIGYDYVELPLGQINLLSDREFLEMKRELDGIQLPVYACNNFLTADIKLCGENVEKEKVRSFYKKALERAAALGPKYVILGSPWSKSCPEGFSKEAAFGQLVEWCQEIGECADQYGITIGLEPNNYTETNMIRTFEETVALAQASAHPRIRCLQDYYHLRIENDTVDSLLKYGKEYLVHTHFARIEERGFPKELSEDSYYQTYFDALHAIGYKGGISMEGFHVTKESFEEEATDTLRFFHRYIRDEI